MKLLTQQNHAKILTENDYCCLRHLKNALQKRADELVQLDLTEFAQFQDNVMRNLEDYEMGEEYVSRYFYFLASA